MAHIVYVTVYSLVLSICVTLGDCLGCVECVKRAFSKSPFADAELLPAEENIVFSNEVYEGCGSELYREVQESYLSSTLPALMDSAYTLTSVNQFSANRLQVSWNVTFVPDSALSVYFMGVILPGVKVVYFDLLARERFKSELSWAAMSKFVQAIVQEGECRVPHAVIMGTTDVEIEEVEAAHDHEGEQVQSSFRLKNQRERLNLVRSYDAGYLKNRKLVTDVIQYMDECRPPHLDVSSHSDLVDCRIDTRKVPGMGQFDLESEGYSSKANAAIELSNKVFPVLFAGLFLSSLYFGSVVFKNESEMRMGGRPGDSVQSRMLKGAPGTSSSATVNGDYILDDFR